MDLHWDIMGNKKTSIGLLINYYEGSRDGPLGGISPGWENWYVLGSSYGPLL